MSSAVDQVSSVLAEAQTTMAVSRRVPWRRPASSGESKDATPPRPPISPQCNCGSRSAVHPDELRYEHGTRAGRCNRHRRRTNDRNTDNRLPIDYGMC